MSHVYRTFGSFCFDDGLNYLVMGVDGLLSGPADRLSAEFARAPGAKLLASRYASRVVTVRGAVVADTPSEFDAKWEALALAFSRENQQLKPFLSGPARHFVSGPAVLRGPTNAGARPILAEYEADFFLAQPFAVADAPSNDLQSDKLLSLVAGNEYKYAWTIPPGGTVYSEPVFTITVPTTTLLTTYAIANYDTDAGLGVSATAWQWSQGFKITPTGPLGKVRLYLKKVGSPTDNLVAYIETDNSGKPSNTVVTNGTSEAVLGSGLSTGYGWITFYFTTPPTLTGGVQYHVVVKRSGGADAVNYYDLACDTSAASYAEGQTCRGTNAGVWTAFATFDLIFEVYSSPSPYGMTKLWVINNSLSSALKLAVIKTFAAADVIVIDSSLFEATINAVAAANTEGAYPSLDPRTANNALELHVLATSPPTLSVTTDFTARFLS